MLSQMVPTCSPIRPYPTMPTRLPDNLKGLGLNSRAHLSIKRSVNSATLVILSRKLVSPLNVTSLNGWSLGLNFKCVWPVVALAMNFKFGNNFICCRSTFVYWSTTRISVFSISPLDRSSVLYTFPKTSQRL